MNPSDPIVNAIALIPARGASKRIPNKNTRLFCGQPLLAYSVNAALQSKLFSRVIVSTDSENIAALAVEMGAVAPFKRPPHIADDHATINDVVVHTLAKLAEQNQTPEFLCCLFATAPMISVADIKQGLKLLRENTQFNQALAVTSFPFPIQRALQVDEKEGLTMVDTRFRNTRSQDLPERYHDAGQFFWSRVTGKSTNARQGALPVFIDRYRVQDIDTPEDWQTAEIQYQAWKIMQKSQGHAA